MCHIGSVPQLCRDKLEDVTKLCVPQFCRDKLEDVTKLCVLQFCGDKLEGVTKLCVPPFNRDKLENSTKLCAPQFCRGKLEDFTKICVPQFCTDRLDDVTNFQYDFVANCSAGIWVSMENRKNWKRQSFESPLETLKKVTNGANYSKMDQVKFVEDSLKQILLGPFLNNLPQTKLLGNFTERQRCIHSPVRYLKWSLLRKSLFSQIARS